MACHTGFLGLLICNCPDMGLVAILAFHARILNMGLVFADRHDIFMAREAVTPVRPRRFVRLVAFVAVELHGPVFRPVYLDRLADRFFVGLEMSDIDGLVSQQFFSVFFAAMAVEALLRSGFEVFCPVGMAVEACELLHPCSVHLPVLVARQAIPFLEAELMRPVAVTFRAFDLFHKDMLCVVPRFADVRRVGLFIVLFPMAAKACLPGHDNFSVPGRDLVVTEHGKIEDLPHLVELGGMVALMAVYAMMYTGRPCLVCGIMNMTGTACIGIVLEIIVDLVGGKEGPEYKDDHDCDDNDSGSA